jgi:hypothetical protein
MIFCIKAAKNLDVFTGAQAWDIRLRGFYVNHTCMGRWLSTRPKIQNLDGLGLKMAMLYFLALSSTSQKNLT